MKRQLATLMALLLACTIILCVGGGYAENDPVEDEWIWPEPPKDEQVPLSEPEETEETEMANNIIKRTWKQNGLVKIEDLSGQVFQNESGGHTFVIRGEDEDGNQIALSGSPAGVFLRPDNTDQALSCSISNGMVYATLPAACYDVPGRAGITIYLTSNGQKTALYAAMVSVGRTSTGTVAPGTTADVVDLINRINEVVATIPPDYSALSNEVTDLKGDFNLEKIANSQTVVSTVFNGTNGICGVDPISISQNGDSLEFKIKTSIPRSNNAFYSFASRGTSKTNIVIAVATNKVCVRAADDTWVCEKNIAESSDYRTIRIECINNNIVTSVDGSVINTYNGLKTITIDWFGYNAQFGYWSGIVEYIKINDKQYQMLSLPGYVPENISYQFPYGNLTEEHYALLEKTATNQNLYAKNVAVDAVFNGTNAYCRVNPIILSSNGDSIEIKAKTSVTRDSNTFYGFATRGANRGDIAIGIATNNISVRASDDTWVCGKNITPSSAMRVFKIELKNNTIVTSVNGEEINTYNGLKTIIIDWFGHNSSFGYWPGAIEYIKVNGTEYKMFDVPGYSGTNITYNLPFGLLTEEQNQALNDSLTVIPASNNVKVYFRISGNQYGLIKLTHELDHSDANYVDYWRIEDSALCISYDGLSFTETSDKLLIGSENEMAVLFRGFDDHIGGWHGDERIDTDNDCYVVFIVDGKEYSISDLVTLGQVQCSTFAYREVSILYAPYSYNANHLKVAKHTKLTTFEKRGFKTKNYVEMDLSNFDQNTLKIGSAYTGLFCIATPFATTVVSDTGTKYTGTHPATTTILVQDLDVFDNTAKTYTNNKSCEIDSRLIKTNVDALNGNVTVTMMDREGDLKYYGYLPNDMDVQTGDYFATEGTMQFMIMNN